jgi:hypothetical protein
MSRSSSSSVAVVVLAFASLLGCASSSGSSGQGAPPTISNFVLTPTTLPAGKATEVSGSMTIEDPDGDLAEATGELLGPDGKVTPTSPVNLSSSAKAVQVLYKIPALPTPVAGDYVITVQAKDHEGNLSAKVSVTLTAK